MDTVGMHQVGQMVFNRLQLGDYWGKVIGRPTKNFSCIIFGESGHGKTTSILRLLKDLCDCGLRATYISHEEGISGTMQDAFIREGIIPHYSGKIILAANATFDETITYFARRGSPEIAVIDSVDYCNLTKEQYKILRHKLKNKIIILISWSKGNDPRSEAAKQIQYMVDVKLHIKNFMVWPKSRYGGNEPAPVWEERARLLNQRYFADLDKRAKKNLFTTVNDPENTNEREGVAAHD